MSELLAPNGNPSNLTPEQYKLVRTPEFKAWFGDWENDPENSSKIIDENGEPKVMYHGTRNSFNVFDIEKSGESNTVARVGFWFTPNKLFAENFAEGTWYGKNDVVAIPVFLNIKNPKIYVSEDVRYGDSYQRFRTDIYRLSGQTEEDANVGGLGMSLNNSKQTIEKYRELLMEENYDGVIINKTRFDQKEAGGLNDQYVCLFPNQIKLADGTNTTFDSNNPDIRFKRGGRTIAQTPAPKKERIYGSKKNKPESSKDTKSAEQIQFNPRTLATIKNKVVEHNKKNPNRKVTLSSAKAVVRRGMGAYSSSHRPTISGGKPNSRVAWGLARLNAFLYKVLNGKSKSGKYNQDDDLIKELGYKVENYELGGQIEYRYFYAYKIENGEKTNETYVAIEKNTPNEVSATEYFLDNNFIIEAITKEEYDNASDDFEEHELYKNGGQINTEYQFRDIGGAIVYYKRINGGDWMFISKEEFDKNSNEKNIILFNSKMENNPKDTITMDIPLFIRMLELAREDIKSDAELHQVVENVIDLKDKVLTMDDYDYFVENKYEEGGMVWNVHILTDDNKIIHKAYNNPVNHSDVFDEYSQKGIKVKDSQIHHSKPIEFFDFLRNESNEHIKNKFGEEIDLDSLMIKSTLKNGEYIATEIQGDTISGRPFQISPDELFSTTFASGGSVSKILQRPYAKLFFYIYNDAYGNMELGTERVEMQGQNGTSIVDGVFLNLGECLNAFVSFCYSDWMRHIMENQKKSKFEIRSSFYDGITVDKYGDVERKEKSILSISTKDLSEYIELDRFKDGGQTEEQKEKISKVMREFYKGTLETSNGEQVIDRKQAIAIALSEAGVEKKEAGGNVFKTNYGDDGKIHNIHFKDGDVSLNLEEYWFDEDSGVELVPVSELLKFREFDRRNSPKWNQDESNRNINFLKNNFMKNGIKEPLIIEYNHEDKMVLLVEGNHRLNSAEEIGLEYLPARVRLKKHGNYPENKKKNAMSVIGVEPNEHGYISSDLKPSQVGIKGSKPLKYEEGGIIEGQLHSECNEPHGCGEKFQVGEVGHIIEAERDEAVIVSEAFKDNKEYTIEGTPSEIASALNVLGDGKNFDKGATVKDENGNPIDLPELKQEATNTDVEPVIEGGSIIINRRSMADETEYEVTGTPKEIASAINSIDGNGVVIEEGAEIKKK